MVLVIACNLVKSNEPSRNCTCMVKPPALPMPWIGGGGSTLILRFQDLVELAVELGEERQQLLVLAARTPIFQDDVQDTAAGQRSVVVERGDARDREHRVDAGDLARDRGSSIERSIGALERGTIGQLHGRKQIALILDRQKSGRQHATGRSRRRR